MISDSSKILARVIRMFGIVAVVSCVFVIIYLLGGCGKTGYPQPRDESRSFAWRNVEANIVGRCIAFTGSFSGAYQYFDGIRLELDAVTGPEDCPGCPFVPDEVTELSPREAGFDPKDGSVAFSYCPQAATAYRWRLAGISEFNRLPHAVMTDRLLVVTP